MKVPHRRRQRHGDAPAPALSWLAELLRQPAALWVSLALALIISANVFSLSRGGTLALLAAAVSCALVWLKNSPGYPRLGAAAVIGTVALGLLAWFGLERVEDRFATLMQAEATWESRGRLWAGGLSAARDFPIWGSGYGTFGYVEPLHRIGTADVPVIYDHAHNEYVEAMVEGGLIRLALTLLGLALVFRYGWRAYSRSPDNATKALVLGGLFALATVAAHSLVDFGMHLPAIAALAAIIAAQISTLGDDSASYVFRWRGVAPVLGLVVVMALSLLLPLEGWRTYLVHRHYHLAMLVGAHGGPEYRDSQLALLEHSAMLNPESALVQQELAGVNLLAYDERINRLDGAFNAVQAAREVAALAGPGWSGLANWLANSATEGFEAAEERGRLQAEHLLPAIQHYVQARDRCPLLPLPQMRIGTHVGVLAKADPPAAYLERAKRLVPYDAELWYLCGFQELLDGHNEQAFASWRRSLELAPTYLEPILEQGERAAGPEGVLASVLPDDPVLIMTAAQTYHPDSLELRRPFAEKTLRLTEGRPPVRAPEVYRARAAAHDTLGQVDVAIRLYRNALALSPDQADWRFELAELLHRQGQLEAARDELILLLAIQPHHEPARAMLKTLSLARPDAR